jgi:hypothetical protein
MKSESFPAGVHVKHAEVVERQGIVRVVRDGVKVPVLSIMQKMHSLIKKR